MCCQDGRTALHHALVNVVCCQDGRTALHHALVHGIIESDIDVARHLIDFGCDVNIKDEVSDSYVTNIDLSNCYTCVCAHASTFFTTVDR